MIVYRNQEALLESIYRGAKELRLYETLPGTVRFQSQMCKMKGTSLADLTRVAGEQSTSPGDGGYCCLLSMSVEYRRKDLIIPCLLSQLQRGPM